MRAEAATRLDGWLERTARENPVVEAVGVDPEEPDRRYLRFRGEDKGASTLWFHLDQRSLHHECHLLPAPEDDHARFYEQLLRRNRGLHGTAFEIGPDGGIYLAGLTDLEAVDDAVLDRILGTVYETIERSFRSLLSCGFATRLGRAAAP